MATYTSTKQKLIDRITTLAGSATTLAEVNYLASALDQVSEDPRYYTKDRHNHPVQGRNNQSIEVDHAVGTKAGYATTTADTITGGVHREYEETATGDMEDGVYKMMPRSKKMEVNFENQPRNVSRPQFAIWAGAGTCMSGAISYDNFLQPYERHWYKGDGTNWCHMGIDGGANWGNYASQQRHSNNSVPSAEYYNTVTSAGNSNTSASHEYHYPSRTGLVGECGHMRINVGPQTIATYKPGDSGHLFKYENLECGTAQLDHRQCYMKYTGKIIHLREKWMVGQRVSYRTSYERGCSIRESRNSPSWHEVTYGWDTTTNALQTFQPAYGSLTYHKERQQLAIMNQLADGQNTYMMKIWYHVDRIRRLTLLDDVLRPEHATYVKFTYSTGHKIGSVEGQQCQKMTMTDDGTVYMTNMALGDALYLGALNKDWAEQTNGIVYELVITNPGTGYSTSQPPIISIAAPNDSTGSQAAGTITVAQDGKCNGYAITNAGSKYVMVGSGINVLTDTTPTPSAAWEVDKSYTDIAQTSTNGSGTGSTFDLTTDSSGNPTVTVKNPGKGFAIGNTVTITDPGNTANTATVTVKSLTGHEMHPTVTVTNHNGGSGLEIVANIQVTGNFDHKSQSPTSGTTYGRENGYHGQQIVMSRDRKSTFHFCPHNGWGAGMHSFIIHRPSNSWQLGYVDANSSFGSNVVAFEDGNFAVQYARDWDGPTNHKIYIFYRKADGTVNATGQDNSWANNDVGASIECPSRTTNYPTIVPIF